MARRVNTRFLTIVTVVVLGSLLAAILVQKVWGLFPNRQRIEQARRSAYAAMAQYEWSKAVEYFVPVAGSDLAEPDDLVAFGDALYHLTPKDSANINKAIRQWQSALERKSDHTGALRRLMHAEIDFVEYAGAAAPAAEQKARLYNADILNNLKRHSEALAGIEPGNTNAAAWARAVPILLAMANLGDANAVEPAIAELEKLGKVSPLDPVIPYYMARGRLFQAQQALVASPPQKDKAQKLRDQAVAVFTEPLRDPRQGAEMYYRAFQVLDMANQRAVGDARKANIDRLQQLIEKARSLAKPGDEKYVEINVSWAYSFRGKEQGKASEAALKNLCDTLQESKQQDISATTEYARSLRHTGDPAKRNEAIALLTAPPEHEREMLGAQAYMRSRLELQRRFLLADLRLDACVAAQGEKEKAMARREAEEAFRSAAELSPAENPAFLMLKARRLLTLEDRAQRREAISLLEAAKEQLGQPDLELTAQLAAAYLAERQTGPVCDLYTAFLEANPGYLPMRQELVQWLIHDGKLDQAAEHLVKLEAQLPDDPRTMRLRILWLMYQDAKGEAAQINALMDKLPEDTAERRFDKAGLALSGGAPYQDRAIKLLEGIGENDQLYGQACATLARIFASRKELDRAKAVLDLAIKKLPDDKGLPLLLKNLMAQTPEERQAAVEQASDAMEPIVRYLVSYQRERQKDPKAACERYLKEAERLAPQDPRVLEVLFNHYLYTLPDLGKAADYCERLSKLNVDEAHGLMYRISLLLAKGDMNGALTAANKVVGLQPNIASSYLMRGKVLQLMEQFEQARDAFASARNRQPTNQEAWRGIIECLDRLKRTEELEKTLREAVRLFPDSAEFAQLRDQIFERQDPEKALPGRRDAWEKDKDSLSSWLLYADALNNCAQRNPAKAEQYLTQSVELLGQGIPRFPDELGIYDRLADGLRRLNKYAEGADLLKRAAEGPLNKSPEAWIALGQYYWRGDDLTKAEQAFKTAGEKAPPENKSKIQKILIAFYGQSRQWDKSIELASALYKSTDDITYLYQLSDMQIAANKLPEARATLTAALEKYPSDPALLTRMGRLHMVSDEVPQAIARFNDAVAVDPKYAAAHYFLGTVYLSNRQSPEGIDQLPKAIDALVQARTLNPREPEYRRLLAVAYRQRNQPREAIRELEAALNVDPFRGELRELLLRTYMDETPPYWAEFDRLIEETQALPRIGADPLWRIMASKGLLRRGQKGPALAKVEEARRMAPQDDAVFSEYLDLLAQNQVFDRMLAETAQAMKDERLAKLWWIHMQKGVALAGAKQRDAAIASFDTAISLASGIGSDPAVNLIVQKIADAMILDDALAFVRAHVKDQPQIRYMEALLCKEKSDFPAAKAAAEAALKDYDRLNSSQQETTLREISQVLIACGQFDKALEVSMKLWSEKLAVNPNADPNGKIAVLNNIACLYAESIPAPNPQEAARYSKMALDTMQANNQRMASVLDTHGWVLVLCGNNGGVDLLREAARADLPEANYHLGEAYLRKSPPDGRAALRPLMHAQHLVEEMIKAKNAPVDPDLPKRIAAAIAKANALKAQAETRPSTSP